MTQIGDTNMKVETLLKGGRFDVVRATFEKVLRNDVMLQRLRSKEPIEAPTKQSITLAALNSLPLRQRLVKMEDRVEGPLYIIDMYVENMA